MLPLPLAIMCVAQSCTVVKTEMSYEEIRYLSTKLLELLRTLTLMVAVNSSTVLDMKGLIPIIPAAGMLCFVSISRERTSALVFYQP